jgi:Tle cognate immunity protein 4 N-terminal domain
MSLKTKRLIFAMVLVVIASLFLSKLLIEHRLSQPIRRHDMSELTKKMRTLCFGRYLIDVPTESEVSLGMSKSDLIEIRRIQSFGNESSFQAKLAEHEATLKSAKHDSEGTRFKGSTTVPGTGTKIFASRSTPERTKLTVLEAFVNSPPGAWHVKLEVADEDISIVQRNIAEIANAIKFRENTTVPTGVGACIQDGLLTRSPAEIEEFAGGARNESLS